MNYQLSPSILAADFACLGEQTDLVEAAGVKWLHIDVMDGMFVPSISLGMPVIASLRKKSNLFFDVHLMVQNPERYLKAFCDAGADMLTIHAESCLHLDSALRSIKKLGRKAGVALNPATPVESLTHVLELVDMVLLMTVNPGFGGQKYISYSDDKIRRLRSMLEERGLEVDIQVDGGIAEETMDRVLEAGANILVAGSAVFNGDVKGNASKMLRRLEAFEKEKRNEK